MRLGFEGDMEFPLGASFQAPQGGDVLVEFDAAGWLNGIRLGECLDDGNLTIEDGVLDIDEGAGTGACEQVRSQIEANVRGSAQVRARSD